MYTMTAATKTSTVSMSRPRIVSHTRAFVFIFICTFFLLFFRKYTIHIYENTYKYIVFFVNTKKKPWCSVAAAARRNLNKRFSSPFSEYNIERNKTYTRCINAQMHARSQTAIFLSCIILWSYYINVPIPIQSNIFMCHAYIIKCLKNNTCFASKL